MLGLTKFVQLIRKRPLSESIDTKVYIGNKTVIEASSLANREAIILSYSEGTSCSSVDDIKKLSLKNPKRSHWILLMPIVNQKIKLYMLK